MEESYSVGNALKRSTVTGKMMSIPNKCISSLTLAQRTIGRRKTTQALLGVTGSSKHIIDFYWATK